MILLTKSQEALGSYKKFPGRNLDSIFVAILVQMMTPKGHFEIDLLLGGTENFYGMPILHYNRKGISSPKTTVGR